MTERPPDTEYAPDYGTYVGKVPDGSILDILAGQQTSFPAFLRSVSDAQAGKAYELGKWTMKEALGHINDAERIFAYRTLRIARGDTTPLPGFEQDDYVPESGANDRSWADLIAEFEAIRASTLFLVRSLPDRAWTRLGTASGKSISTRALVWILAGHVIHHERVLRERYL